MCAQKNALHVIRANENSPPPHHQEEHTMFSHTIDEDKPTVVVHTDYTLPTPEGMWHNFRFCQKSVSQLIALLEQMVHAQAFCKRNDCTKEAENLCKAVVLMSTTQCSTTLLKLLPRNSAGEFHQPVIVPEEGGELLVYTSLHTEPHSLYETDPHLASDIAELQDTLEAERLGCVEASRTERKELQLALVG